MASLRFNHVFTGLLLISGLCAFVIPPRFTNPVRAYVQGMFFPVARPARLVAERTLGRFQEPRAIDGRSDRDIRDENQQLRATVASLTAELERLQGIAADFARVGNIAGYCTRATVVGSATGQRDALPIQGPLESTGVGDPVIYEQSIVGKIDRVGIGSAQVRLISDKGMVIRARFGRFVAGEFDAVSTNQAVVEGNGSSTMVITSLELKDVTKVKQGDWVVLDDPDWPKELQGLRLGTVKQIRPRTNAPLFAEIVVYPQWNLLALPDVMVVDKIDKATERPSGEATKGTGEAAARNLHRADVGYLLPLRRSVASSLRRFGN